jgi:hypothetical protein
MSKEEAGGDMLDVEFPVWTIANKSKFKDGGLLHAIPKMMCPDIGGPFFPLFTDKDLAETFIERFSVDGAGTVTLLRNHALAVLLTDLEKLGCNHVGLDVSKIGGRISGRFYPSREVLDAIVRQQP